MEKRELPVEAVTDGAEHCHLETSVADRVIREVASHDVMFDPNAAGSVTNYARVGADALCLLRACMMLAHRPRPEKIIDFGCGSGRVMRWLRAGYPEASIVGSDVSPDDVDFCARQFGSTPVVSSTNFLELPSFQDADLIWAGSVVTHLRESDTDLLIDAFIKWLRVGGVAVFSSHGRIAVQNLVSGAINYLQGADASPLLRDYGAIGYGYTAYPKTPTYGVSAATPAWFSRRIARHRGYVRMICYAEQGWSHHHDVVAIQRMG